VGGAERAEMDRTTSGTTIAVDQVHENAASVLRFTSGFSGRKSHNSSTLYKWSEIPVSMAGY